MIAMRAAIGRLLATGLCLVLLATHAGAQGRPPADLVNKAKQSVVRVMADGCPSQRHAGGASRTGSGFVWPDAAHVVTALHVVSDCATLTVEYVEAGVQSGARLARGLRDADLVLLEVESPPTVAALRTAARAEAQADVAAIGLPANTVAIHESYGVIKSTPLGPLKETLNPHAASQLRKLGSPHFDLEVLFVTPDFRPGLSGGPLIDFRGEVVGVVDGGLDGGNASLNWAVPASNLERLRDSGEDRASLSLGEEAEVVFAYSIPPALASSERGQAVVAEINAEVSCGGRRFFKLATRTVGEIVGSLAEVEGSGVLDDPAGFLTLVDAFSMIIPVEEVLGLRYDLLVDTETSATIALPWGNELVDHGDGCVAEAEESDISVAFQSRRLDLAQTDAQLASEEFERRVAEGYEFVQCAADPMLVEPVPHFRFDGLMARRQGAYCLSSYATDPTYVFLAHLAREDSFAGIVAVNEEYALTGMGGDPAVTRDWVAAALAVLLSTYQI